MRATRRPIVVKSIVAPAVKEWRLQAAAVTALRRMRDKGWPIRIAGDMNAGRRSMREASLASATGMNPGEPDLRVYLPGGKLLSIEFKAPRGKVSPAQKAAHEELAGLGFEVVTIQPADEIEAAHLTLALVVSRLPANDNEFVAAEGRVA